VYDPVGIAVKTGSSVEGRQRILFVLPRLVSGGVERVTLNLVSMLRASGIECVLAVGRKRGQLLAEAEAMVEVHALAPDGWHTFVPRLTRMINAWRPTHVVTAFADVGLMTWVAIRLARHPPSLIHGVHDTLGIQAARPGFAGRMRHHANNTMARFLFRRADAVIAVSEGVRQDVLRRTSRGRVVVRRIYNPVLARHELGPVVVPTPDHDGPLRMVALGRLARQKGFDLLVDAVAGLELHTGWTLDIYGEGPMRGPLAERIEAHGLQDRVRLCGLTTEPLQALPHYDLFVMPSRHEGFGNVLVEALAKGLPVIAADCPHGPREILANGRFGQLVPPENPAALASAIVRHARGEIRFDPRTLVARAGDFTVEASFAAWRDVLNETQPQATTASGATP
jgi:glycosyltransferase involved in cell wall biosynthesis